MMFALKAFISLALPLLVIATPLTVRNDTPACNTGSLNCCQSTTPAAGVAGLLGVLQGLNCSPISVIGVGTGNTCNQQTVCCTGNQNNGLVNLSCMPISIGL